MSLPLVDCLGGVVSDTPDLSGVAPALGGSVPAPNVGSFSPASDDAGGMVPSGVKPANRNYDHQSLVSPASHNPRPRIGHRTH